MKQLPLCFNHFKNNALMLHYMENQIEVIRLVNRRFSLSNPRKNMRNCYSLNKTFMSINKVGIKINK